MYKVIKHFTESVVDPETKEQYERESYTLSSKRRVIWDAKSQKWRDRHNREYTPVHIAGKLVGFNLKDSLAEEDKKLLRAVSGADPRSIAASYLDYNREVGGEPFGFTTGMPIEADPEKYGGIAKMYRECIKRGVTWEELLQWDGRSDELNIC